MPDYHAVPNMPTIARERHQAVIEMIRIDHLDHLVLTVASIERSAAFYCDVLGMRVEIVAGGRTALRFGRQKINLHEMGREFEPTAGKPTPGSADLCLMSVSPLEQVIAHLSACAVALVAGPLARTGATGPIRSVYIRDPDGNLIEISHPHT